MTKEHFIKTFTLFGVLIALKCMIQIITVFVFYKFTDEATLDIYFNNFSIYSFFILIASIYFIKEKRIITIIRNNGVKLEALRIFYTLVIALNLMFLFRAFYSVEMYGMADIFGQIVNLDMKKEYADSSNIIIKYYKSFMDAEIKEVDFIYFVFYTYVFGFVSYFFLEFLFSKKIIKKDENKKTGSTFSFLFIFSRLISILFFCFLLYNIVNLFTGDIDYKKYLKEYQYHFKQFVIMIFIIYYTSKINFLKEIKNNIDNEKNLIKIILILQILLGLQVLFYEFILDEYIFNFIIIFFLVYLRDKMTMPEKRPYFNFILIFFIISQIIILCFIYKNELTEGSTVIYSVSQILISLIFFFYKDTIEVYIKDENRDIKFLYNGIKNISIKKIMKDFFNFKEYIDIRNMD